MVPHDGTQSSYKLEHPRLVFGITRVPLVILHIHPHMGQDHTLILVPVVAASAQSWPEGLAKARAVRTAGYLENEFETELEIATKLNNLPSNFQC